MAGLLDSLGTVATDDKPKTSKSTRPVIDFAGLANYAALSTVAKQIDALLKAHPVRTAALNYFVAEGRRVKKTPQNVDGRDGVDATASVQLRKRNSNQPLDADTVALCADLGIHVEPNVKRHLTIRMKPELFAKIKDDKAIEKLIEAGAKALGMNPSEVFEVQTELSDMLCADKSLDDLFGLGTNHSNDRIGEILQKLAGATITPKFQGSLAAAMDVVRIELVPTPTEMKAREAAAAAVKPDSAPKSGTGSLMDALKASLDAEGGDVFGLPPGGGANKTGRGRKGK